MLRFLPGPVFGVIALTAVVLNTLFWCIPLFAIALVKLLVRTEGVQRRLAQPITWIGERWIQVNNRLFGLAHPIEWEISGMEGLCRDAWYLMFSNHLSSVDIPLLQHVFAGRVPFIRFFIKQNLIWVPILGQAWWALDFPFMKRHSRAFLEKHPERRIDDLNATRQACRRFRHMPTTILNFVEGTRLTPAKHAAQDSPYHHLLRPRAGGLAYTLAAMGDLFSAILDVTIVYPDGPATLWDLASGRVRRVTVHVEQRAIPPDLLQGDYLNDPAFRARVQNWLHEIWLEKDALIERLQPTPASAEKG